MRNESILSSFPVYVNTFAPRKSEIYVINSFALRYFIFSGFLPADESSCQLFSLLMHLNNIQYTNNPKIITNYYKLT